MIFTESGFYDRIAMVKEAGLAAFEFWELAGKDVAKIHNASETSELNIAAFTMSSCDQALSVSWQEYGLANPAGRSTAIEVARESIIAAQSFNARNIIVTVGRENKELSRSVQHNSIVDGLKLIAPLAEEAGVVMVIEPLNVLVDHKGYYLSSSAEGFDTDNIDYLWLSRKPRHLCRGVVRGDLKAINGRPILLSGLLNNKFSERMV